MHIRATNFGSSKQARFKSITTNSWDSKRSPAYYNPKEAVYSANDTLSPAFRMPIAAIDKFGSVNQGLVRARWGSKPTPGPGMNYRAVHTKVRMIYILKVAVNLNHLYLKAVLIENLQSMSGICLRLEHMSH
jgi:hypothetical protein